MCNRDAVFFSQMRTDRQSDDCQAIGHSLVSQENSMPVDPYLLVVLRSAAYYYYYTQLFTTQALSAARGPG